MFQPSNKTFIVPVLYIISPIINELYPLSFISYIISSTSCSSTNINNPIPQLKVLANSKREIFACSLSQLKTGGVQTYNENLIQWAASLYYDGASQINGTSSSETIFGTMGDDTIFSKDGADELWGGAGADTYIYKQIYQSDPGGDGQQNDTILDFNYSEDRIDISAITNGASVSRTLTNGTLFKIDTDNNGSYDMQWDLDYYTGTADQVNVVT